MTLLRDILGGRPAADLVRLRPGAGLYSFVPGLDGVGIPDPRGAARGLLNRGCTDDIDVFVILLSGGSSFDVEDGIPDFLLIDAFVFARELAVGANKRDPVDVDPFLFSPEPDAVLLPKLETLDMDWAEP